MVIVWLLTTVALLAACNVMLPELPRARLHVGRRHPTGQGAGRQRHAAGVVVASSEIHSDALRTAPLNQRDRTRIHAANGIRLV